MRNNRIRLFVYYPIVLASVLAVGVYLGSLLSVGHIPSSVSVRDTDQAKKIGSLLNYVLEEYVDTVDLEGLTESTIISMLNQLDPHSSYIPAKDLEASNEPLEGNFDGIGVEFNIINDTIVVVAPISGGPSEKLGILSGDRIVSIEDSIVAGTGVTNADVISMLRGKRGTKVKVGIARRGEPELLTFLIERDKIPIYSVDTGYMINDRTGYIKISRFAATTHDEFVEKLDELKAAGMRSLILDLRGNPGGYLTAAIDVSDEFLPAGQLIVYTEGRARPKESAYATSNGRFEKGPLVILVDEGSASASEIVSGAVQDNDRGIIIGRRTFGKGLVQEQAELPDGSAVRLTIARYYTPTGRCIQRPYGKDEDYYSDLMKRIENGELYEADSIHVNKDEKFVTPAGKTVYGGGGIVPDVFVPLDTTSLTPLHAELLRSGLLREYALEFIAERHDLLDAYPDALAFDAGFVFTEADFEDLVQFARAHDIDAPARSEEEKDLMNNLKALIARSKWNGDGFYPIINKRDKAVQEALKQLETTVN